MVKGDGQQGEFTIFSSAADDLSARFKVCHHYCWWALGGLNVPSSEGRGSTILKSIGI
jgi:hypothetical protein